MEDVSLLIKELLEQQGFGNIIAINVIDKRNIRIYYEGDSIEEED